MQKMGCGVGEMETSMSTEVNRDKVVNVWRVNLPQIVTTVIAAIGSIVTIVWAVGSLRTDVTVNTKDIKRIQDTMQGRQTYVDTQINTINNKLNDMGNYGYRITTAEANIDSTNKRVDQITSTINTAVEGIRKDISDLTTKVEVQSNKIDTLGKKVDQLSSSGKISYTRSVQDTRNQGE